MSRRYSGRNYKCLECGLLFEKDEVTNVKGPGVCVCEECDTTERETIPSTLLELVSYDY